ncbi:YrhK family protein [Enterococcus faecium]|uniref:YrhK family protein n=6 Tax=Enterococcus TaxID=1350 RepID=UPI0021AD5510|nr:YrhK family protein [Enterococcus faecium]UWS53177.1 YrhK family protein [Enterococcus faecium]
MPKIKRNTHEIEIGKEEDIEIRGRRFRFYFQNRYTLISLAVDLLTGIFYIFGSLASLTKIPDRYGTYFYLAGAIFLTIRPILRIVRNIFIYDEKKARKKHENACFLSLLHAFLLFLCCAYFAYCDSKNF